MTRLYIASKYITFIGAYLRGFWEHLTCRILGLPIEAPGYLRIDEACGHVEHIMAGKGFAAYLIATGPGFMNLATGVPIFLAGFFNLKYLGITRFDSVPLFIFYLFMVYAGISMLCNVFPLVEDAVNLYEILYSQKKGNFVGRILAFVPAAVSCAGAYAEKYCLTLLFWIIFIALDFIF